MSAQTKYKRFTISDRIEHWVQMAAFFTLGFTGLIQRYAEWPLSLKIMDFLGGIENVRLIHHTAAIVLMFAVIYHIGAAGYKYYVKRNRIKMLPNLQDITNAWGWIVFNLGATTGIPNAKYSSIFTGSIKSVAMFLRLAIIPMSILINSPTSSSIGSILPLK